MAHLREIVNDKLKSVQRYANVKTARKKLTRTIAQKSGVITVKNVRISPIYSYVLKLYITILTYLYFTYIARDLEVLLSEPYLNKKS